MEQTRNMRGQRKNNCVVCGRSGALKYEGMKDGLFGVAGTWSIRQCQQPNCWTLWLDPCPIPEDIAEAYENYFTHTSSARQTLMSSLIRHLSIALAFERSGTPSRISPLTRKLLLPLASFYPGLLEHLELQLRYLPAPNGVTTRLLDVGCGSGEALDVLTRVGWDACGIEVDPKAVAVARRKNLAVFEGTLSEAPFSPCSFDAVTSSHVFEHVHDQRLFLNQCFELLRPGGTLVLITPNVRSASHERFGRSWLGLDPPRHLALFDRKGLMGLASNAGFSALRCHETARATAIAAVASESLRRRGYYRWQSWPGLRVWLRAQVRQLQATRKVAAGIENGEELVLVAKK